ncbi:hypothetical protein ABR737_38895 [Streptomyces sp. Edi2]|uniref:hypothetical protein n=1 Tax=Streptomyces sp. Edi2 TaxID=3162528 RepID=UPI0033067E5A
MVEVPAYALDGSAEDVGLVFRSGVLRVDGSVCDPKELWITGQAVTTGLSSPVPVHITFTRDGELIAGTPAVADLGEGRKLLLVDGTPAGAELPPGAWAVVDGQALRLTRRAPAPPTDGQVEEGELACAQF